MRIKDGLLLVILSLTVGWMIVHAQPRTIQESSPVVDTAVIDTPTTINVKGKQPSLLEIHIRQIIPMAGRES